MIPPAPVTTEIPASSRDLPSFPGPAFLRGLDHVMATDNGWIAQCPVYGCQHLLEITPGADGHWQLTCHGDHAHDEIAGYLQGDTRLDPIMATRAWRALVLSPTPEIWQALLAGQHVPVSALDPTWARRFGLR